MRLLSPQTLKLFNARLAAALDDLPAAAALGSMHAAIRDCVLAGGKRIRPQLVLWTWQQCEREDDDRRDVALDLAVGWELFHAFLLVHDDIIDGADERHGSAALHRRLADLDHGAVRFGQNLAIVAGDLLYTAALRKWHELELDGPAFRRQLRLFTRIAELTGWGQAIDIVQAQRPLASVDEPTLMLEYYWKTAAYTFEGPMVSAAVAAGLGEEVEAIISRFALSLGQAYQLHNDLIDLAQPAGPGSDLVQAKRTVTLLLHRSSLAASERASLDRLMDDGGPLSIEAAETVRRQLLDGGAVDETRERIATLIAQAREDASASRLPARLSDGLLQLLAALSRSYFSSAAADHQPTATVS